MVVVNALQHVGIGVSSISGSYDFYRRFFGFRFTMSESEYDIWELEPMFGRKPRMRIHNSMQPCGGPTLELFQHVDAKPRERDDQPTWADLGLMEIGFWVIGLDGIIAWLESQGEQVLVTGNASKKKLAGPT